MWVELTSAILGAVMAMFLYDSYYKESLPPFATTINTSYDYVIVGGGSAGCVLASRLSEDPDITVLLIEAGGDDRGREDISTPAFYGRVHHTDIDWYFYSVPQKHGFDDHAGKRVYFPRGRVLGGSSSTNYLCYVRSHPRDFDNWAEKGCDGWSYTNILPYFFKSEGFVSGKFGDSDLEVGGRSESWDPFDDPLIDPSYFRDPEDMATLLKGIDICKRFVQTPSLQSLGAQAADGLSAACVGPDSAYDSEAYWMCMVRRRSVSYYHPVGTAKMGSANDFTAVVDSSLRVCGISSLRVVDASVIPTIPSANTNAAVIMIAEKASDIIRANRKSKTSEAKRRPEWTEATFIM